MLRLLLLSFILLTGCSTQPVITYNTKVISPDDNLILDCTFTHPPDTTTYMQTPANDREKVLADYVNTLLNDGIICNQKFVALREWKKQTTNVINMTK